MPEVPHAFADRLLWVSGGCNFPQSLSQSKPNRGCLLSNVHIAETKLAAHVLVRLTLNFIIHTPVGFGELLKALLGHLAYLGLAAFVVFFALVVLEPVGVLSV